MVIFNKKAAIGLSVNVLVILIISLVIFAGGISLLYKFYHQSVEYKKDLDERTKQKLENLLLEQGKQVALSQNSANLHRGEDYTFGIGILNTRRENPEEEFQMKVELTKVFNENNDEITISDPEALVKEMVLYYPKPIRVKDNEYEPQAIMVVVPKDAANGEYHFSVKVYLKNSLEDTLQPGDYQYGNTQRFSVSIG